MGRQIGLSNCLATRRPDVSKQWHPTKNGDLTPYDVTYRSIKKVWFICDLNHEWETRICHRNNGTGCPYCAGQLATNENNLLKINPTLALEWNYKKNIDNPSEYAPNSGKLVWWVCNQCGYEWEKMICERNYGGKCPFCNQSFGEKTVSYYLSSKNIPYIHQINFSGLFGIGGGLLSYDFYLHDYRILIEVQGEFHDGNGNYFVKQNLKRQQEHDRRKKEYATEKGYNFLEIWYWDFDRIEEILETELNKLKIKETS